MEQLTQMELLQLRELMSMEALAAKKCRMYAAATGDDQLRTLWADSAQVHRQNLDALMDQLRALSGKSSDGAPRPAQPQPDQQSAGHRERNHPLGAAPDLDAGIRQNRPV